MGSITREKEREAGYHTPKGDPSLKRRNPVCELRLPFTLLCPCACVSTLAYGAKCNVLYMESIQQIFME